MERTDCVGLMAGGVLARVAVLWWPNAAPDADGVTRCEAVMSRLEKDPLSFTLAPCVSGCLSCEAKSAPGHIPGLAHDTYRPTPLPLQLDVSIRQRGASHCPAQGACGSVASSIWVCLEDDWVVVLLILEL